MRIVYEERTAVLLKLFDELGEEHTSYTEILPSAVQGVTDIDAPDVPGLVTRVHVQCVCVCVCLCVCR